MALLAYQIQSVNTGAFKQFDPDETGVAKLNISEVISLLMI